MDLTLTPEQAEIVTSSAAFLRTRLPSSSLRQRLDSHDEVDAAVWSAAAELGWFALGLPEDRGGVGFGLADEALLFREIGRSLAPGPFLSTVLAARIATLAGCDELAGRIVGGAERVGLVLGGGEQGGVVRLLDADQSFVVALSPSAAALVAVDALHDVRRVRCVDPASSMRRATAGELRPVAIVQDEVDAIGRRGHVLAAAMLTGIAEAARDIAAEHARNRIQFDRPIGVHQAVKHPCAEMAVHAERAFAQTAFAAVAHDEGRRDAEFHATSALVVATEAAERSTAATIQVLGGMGFTFEHDAHLFVKRARVVARLFGAPSDHLAHLLTLAPAE